MTETTHASSEAQDSERLIQILGEARDDEGRLWALHRAIEAAVALPLDVDVIGEPLVTVAVEYDGNARRGLVARCRREDGSEYRIGLADVEMPARTPAARHAAAYRAWVGIGPDAGAAATHRGAVVSTRPAMTTSTCRGRWSSSCSRSRSERRAAGCSGVDA